METGELTIEKVQDMIIELFAIKHQLGSDEVESIHSGDKALYVTDDDGSGNGKTFHINISELWINEK